MEILGERSEKQGRVQLVQPKLDREKTGLDLDDLDKVEYRTLTSRRLQDEGRSDRPDPNSEEKLSNRKVCKICLRM